MADRPRRKKFPVPPAAEQQDHGTLPPPPGTVLGRVPLDVVRGQSELTDDEKQIIAAAGWKPGDPVPNLRGTKVGQHMQAAVDAVREKAEDVHGMSPIDPATEPLEVPEPVDINDLPPDEQERAIQIFKEMDELQDRMNMARRARTKTQPLPPQITGTPGAAQAIGVAAAAAAAEREQQPGVTLVDDLGITGDQPFKLKKPAAAPAQPESAPEISSPEQVSAEAGGDLTDATTHCPQCNFDLNGELVAPSTEDIVAYLSTLMGEGRFRKEARLFGGRIIVVFRGLLPKEVDMALQLADDDVVAGNITHITQYARVAETYKLIMGIESVTRTGQSPINLPAVSDIEEPTNGRSSILQLKEYLDNDVFTTDSLRRTVGLQWIKFNRMLQYMEAKSDDPDFFDVTA